MSDHEVIARLRSYLAGDLGHDRAAALAADESLITSGILDSMRLLKLIAFIEEAFAVDIPVGDLEPDNFASLARIASFVATKRAG